MHQRGSDVFDQHCPAHGCCCLSGVFQGLTAQEVGLNVHKAITKRRCRQCGHLGHTCVTAREQKERKDTRGCHPQHCRRAGGPGCVERSEGPCVGGFVLFACLVSASVGAWRRRGCWNCLSPGLSLCLAGGFCLVPHRGASPKCNVDTYPRVCPVQG